MEKPTVKIRTFRAARMAGKATLFAFTILAFFYWYGGQQHTSISHEPPQVLVSDVSYDNAPGVVLYSYAKLDRALASETKPAVVFIYTSWCPYCQKDFPLMNEAAKRNKEDIAFYFVSVDADPAAFSRFLRGLSETNFTPFNIATRDAMADLEAGLKHRGVHYNGGFPFFAAFNRNKPIIEVTGLLEKDALLSMLADIKAAGAKPAPLAGEQETKLEGH